MAPQFVKPYVKTNKNDMADAEAICEAVARPNMRFVPVKTLEAQAILAVHRARQGFVRARTAQGNQIRGLLAEFGIVIPKGLAHITQRIPEILEDAENGLPDTMRPLIERLAEHLKVLDREADALEAQIQHWHRQNASSRKLEKIPGIGPITGSRPRRHGRRCQKLPERPATRGLPRARPEAALERRQADPAWYQ